MFKLTDALRVLNRENFDQVTIADQSQWIGRGREGKEGKEGVLYSYVFCAGELHNVVGSTHAQSITLQVVDIPLYL